MSEPFGAHH